MQINQYIDHTLLKPEAQEADIAKLCQEALDHQFKSVCVNSYWVDYCAQKLDESEVLVCTVVGFPLGASTKETKAFEAAQALDHGASEIDMVINIGALKAGDDDTVLADIEAVLDEVRDRGLLKVIIETSLLTDEEKVRACQIAKQAGADYVKTSTGFSTGGATLEDVALMRETVGPEIGVKASGGVSSYEDAIAMIEAGATRIGTSRGVSLVQ